MRRSPACAGLCSHRGSSSYAKGRPPQWSKSGPEVVPHRQPTLAPAEIPVDEGQRQSSPGAILVTANAGCPVLVRRRAVTCVIDPSAPSIEAKGTSLLLHQWKLPTYCNQCPHRISGHVLWEPDESDAGWMRCTVAGCTTCWHYWPKLDEPTTGQRDKMRPMGRRKEPHTRPTAEQMDERSNSPIHTGPGGRPTRPHSNARAHLHGGAFSAMAIDPDAGV